MMDLKLAFICENRQALRNGSCFLKVAGIATITNRARQGGLK